MGSKSLVSVFMNSTRSAVSCFDSFSGLIRSERLSRSIAGVVVVLHHLFERRIEPLCMYGPRRVISRRPGVLNACLALGMLGGICRGRCRCSSGRCHGSCRR